MQSVKQPDGVFIDNDDILSFELTEDNAILYGFPSGSSQAGNSAKNKCKSLLLKIIAKNNPESEILLPFITFAMEKRNFAYQSAFQAAKEISESLSGILQE